MEKEFFSIDNIPAVIWGSKSDKVFVAIHGNMSNKADVPIEILAKNAVAKGYQVLSFDLPEHGDRKNESRLFKVENCIEDLITVMKYAKSKWKNINLFANSIGAYFSLLAYSNTKLYKALFLSPVLDMKRIIENMMRAFSITEDELEKKQTISTPIGQTLYWDYYCFVRDNPILSWNAPTCILCGEKDTLCEIEITNGFSKKFSTKLDIAKCAEHYFHMEEELKILNNWFKDNIY